MENTSSQTDWHQYIVSGETTETIKPETILKMREALKALVEYWDWGGYDAMREYSLKEEARRVLTMPLRNCDVLTPEEMAVKYFELCNPHLTCRECPINMKVSNRATCEFVWAQLPCEEKKD